VSRERILGRQCLRFLSLSALSLQIREKTQSLPSQRCFNIAVDAPTVALSLPLVSDVRRPGLLPTTSTPPIGTSVTTAAAAPCRLVIVVARRRRRRGFLARRLDKMAIDGRARRATRHRTFAPPGHSPPRTFAPSRKSPSRTSAPSSRLRF